MRIGKEYKMIANKEMAKIFEMTPQGIRKWKIENRPIIKLLEKYFTEEDLTEFLNTGEIKNFENKNKIDENIFDEKINTVYDLMLDNEIFYLRNLFEKLEMERPGFNKCFVDIIPILKDIGNNPNYTGLICKEILYERLKGFNPNDDFLSKFISNNLSKLQVFSLVKNYKIILKN